jgi:hypothetical protein
MDEKQTQADSSVKPLASQAATTILSAAASAWRSR